MNIYFVSDFHLKYIMDDEAIARQTRILKFLKNITGKADVLIMAGDIFDLWYSWKTVIIKEYFEVLTAFYLLKKSGCRLVFIAGNHDFWFNNFLQKTIGMEIYYDDFCQTFDGKKVFVSHGDLYTKSDLRYKIFRKAIRNKISKALFNIMHPNIGLKLGSFLSRSSRKKKRPANSQIKKENGLTNFAKKMHAKGFDIVVMGHSHKPKYEQYGNKIYANCGDWITNNTYLQMVNGEIKLKTYKGE